jgi:hypothetical protein
VNTSTASLEPVFRPSLHRFLVLFTAILGAGAAGLFHAVRGGAIWGWPLVLTALALDTTLAARFAAQAVIIGQDRIVVRAGTFCIRQVTLALHHVHLEVRQDLVGWWLDDGTVLFQAGNTVTVIRHLGQIRAFRHLVGARRQELLQRQAVPLTLQRPSASR